MRGIGEKLDEEVWLNKEVNTVASEEESFRMKKNYMLTKHGITLPTMMCYCSQSGSITAELLVAMLQQTDLFSSVFDRSDDANFSLFLMAMGVTSTLHSWSGISVPQSTISLR